MQMGLPVARMEFVDENTIKCTNAYGKLNHVESPTLWIELHGSEGSCQEQLEMVTECAQECEVGDITWASSAADRKELWTARHSAYYAILVSFVLFSDYYLVKNLYNF